MVTPSCLSCQSEKCFINRYVKKEWQKKVNRQRTTLVYGKGQVIFKEGDPVNGIYFIYDGKVKVYNRGVKNRPQIVRMANTGQILGHRGLGTPHGYPIGASAIENSTLCFIPTEVFLETMKHNPDLVMELMLFFAGELRRAESKLRSLSQMTVRQKLAETFLTLAEIYGTTRHENAAFIKVQLSRQEYADITGASLEEVIRTISQMAKANLVVTEGKRIGIADRKKLEEMLVDFGPLRLP